MFMVLIGLIIVGFGMEFKYQIVCCVYHYFGNDYLEIYNDQNLEHGINYFKHCSWVWTRW